MRDFPRFCAGKEEPLAGQKIAVLSSLVLKDFKN